MGPPDRFFPEPRRRATDDFDSRRESAPWRPPDYNRERNDHGYDRGRPKEHDRDRGRERDSDRDRDRNRDRAFDHDSRRGSPNRMDGDSLPARGPSNALPRKPSNGPYPIGPKSIASPSWSEPQKVAEHAKMVSSPTTDTLRNLRSMLKISGQLSNLEHEKSALERLARRRAEESRKSTVRSGDFPSIEELMKRTTALEKRKWKETDNAIRQNTVEISKLTSNFVMDLNNLAKRSNNPDDGLVKTVQMKQEELEKTIESQGAGSKSQVDGLKSENEKLRSDLASVTADLKQLTKRLDNIQDSTSASTTKTENELERLGAQSVKHATRLEILETKTDGHDKQIGGTDASIFAEMVEFFTTEKARMAEGLDEQKKLVEALRNEVKELRETQQAHQVQAVHQEGDIGQLVTAPTQTAPEMATEAPRELPAAPSAALSAVRATASREMNPLVVSAGLASLWQEMSSLRAQLGSLESLRKELTQFSDQQTKALAAVHVRFVKQSQAQEKMADGFGSLVDSEAQARQEMSDKLKELERMVFQVASTNAANARINSHSKSNTAPAPGTTMAGMPDGAPDTLLLLDQLPEPIPETFGEPLPEPLPEPVPEAFRTDEGDDMSAIARTAGLDSNAHLSGGSSFPTLQGLLGEIQALQKRLETAEQGISEAKTEINGQCAALRLMVSTLDTQYHNLTTKELFNAIVGHIEKLYPNTRQLQQDMEGVATRIRTLEQLNRGSDDTITRLIECVGIGAGPQMAKRTLGQSNGNGAGVSAAPAAENGAVSGSDGQTPKRRKLTNGPTPTPTENGHAPGPDGTA